MLLLTSLLGCDAIQGLVAPPPPPEPDVPEHCKAVHIDKLADADWIGTPGGSRPDPNLRMRILPTKDGTGYTAWYVGGFLGKTVLKGKKRDAEVQFTEVAKGVRKEAYDSGQGTIRRLYVKPKFKDCAIEVFAGQVDKNDKEQVPVKGIMFRQLRPQDAAKLSFRPATATVFLGEAASKPKKADKQVAELGGARPDHPMGDVPVGMWSDAAADGAESCTFDMDLFFDGKRADGGPIPAGAVKDGKRHWFHTWDAPYTGNHLFEFYRFRTCDGETRELIGVAALEAVLI